MKTTRIMENKDALTPEQQSLRLINEMILTAKRGIQENGFLYLFWGWAVFLTALTHYALLHFSLVEHPYLIWISMPLAEVVSIIYTRKKARKEKVHTLFDTFMKYLWLGFLISLVIVLIGMVQIGWQNGYPMLMVLFGLGTFVSGGALKFRPLILGGIGSWVIALIAFFMPFDVQLLLLALAIMVSHLIPGHILKAKHKQSHV